jgi:hypothetical protein
VLATLETLCQENRSIRFTDTSASRELRLSIGIEEESGKYYLSIPVSNRLVDYEEYYEISEDALEAYGADLDTALSFADQCRGRKNDHLLIQKPGSDRGVG